MTDAAERGCDTSDMRLAHTVYRAIFADGPMLVDAVPVGDERRRRAVAAHLKELAIALHHHHATEDLLLWDDLERRAPGCALHVGLMRAQHARMAEALAEAEDALPRWADSGTDADRRQVRDAMAEIDRLLREHFADEEELILPPASAAFTQAEWNRLGEYAGKQTRPGMMFPQLGFLLDALPPEEGERFLSKEMPRPIRWLWQVVGRGQYRRYRRRVYG